MTPRILQSTRFRRRRPQAGFTLIELMVVIIIIVVLAGLTVAITTAVQNKARRAKSEAIMRAIDNSLERYRTDNGDFPRPANEDETGEINGINAPIGPARCLYQALTGDGDDAIEGGDQSSDGKSEDEDVVYMDDITDPLTLKRSQVYTENGDFILVDPWQHPWQYEVYKPEESNEFQANTNNLTYDLWSFGTDETAGKDPELRGRWVTNW